MEGTARLGGKKVYVTGLLVRRLLGYLVRLRYMRLGASACRLRIPTGNRSSPVVAKMSGVHVIATVEPQRTSKKCCARLRGAVVFDAIVQLLSRSIGTNHILFGVLGKRQLAPLCRIW